MNFSSLKLITATVAMIFISMASFAQISDLHPDGGTSDETYQGAFGYINLNDPPVVNTDLPVGRTKGYHGVSATGGATYTIPLTLPPGAVGMTPNLNLVYNSQGGDGPLGLGWSLTAVSAITRVQHDIIHDEEVKPMNWSVDCPIAIDGMRLMLMSGSNLTPGAVYGKEIEDFSKIYFYNSGEGEYFEVHTKDGMIYRYGYSLDSRVVNSNGDTYSWLLDKVSDLNENFYGLYYTWAYGEQVLDRIEYTGNYSGSSPFIPTWKVEFDYEERIDPNAHFIQGLMLRRSALLRKITVEKINWGTIAKKYFINYTTQDGHSLLREITEIGKSNTPLNSTKVRYGSDDGQPYVATDVLMDGGPDSKWISGDFNGDGISDLAKFTGVSFLGQSTLFTSLEIFSRPDAYSSAFSSVLVYSLPIPLVIPKSKSLVPGRALDFNGDGVDDLALLDISIQNQELQLDNVYLYHMSSLSWTMPSPQIISFSSWSTKKLDSQDPDRAFIPGDFDGDGRMDFIAALTNSSGVQYYPVVFGGSTQIQQFYTSPNLLNNPQDLRVIDVNGDGKSEILCVDSSALYDASVYSLAEPSFGNIWNMTTYYQGTYPTSNHRLYTGDFNGDGRTDLMTFDGTACKKVMSDGYGWYDIQPFDQGSLVDFFDDCDIVVADFNGDAMSDILKINYVLYGSNYTVGSQIKLYQSKGGSFSFEEITNTGFPFYENVDYQNLIGDYNGDGRMDLIYRHINNSAPYMMRMYQFEPTTIPRLAVNIADGFDYDVQFKYRTLCQSSAEEPVYQKGALSETYPLCIAQFPLYVVWETNVPDGVGAFNSSDDDIRVQYKYYQAVLHKQGRGFIGFKTLETANLDINQNLKTISSIEIQQGVYLPHPTQTVQLVGSNWSTKLETQGYYAGLTNSRWWFKTDWTLQKDFINSSSTKTEYAYLNNDGNATSITVFEGLDLAGSFGSEQSKTTTILDYDTYSGTMNNGKIMSTVTCATRQSKPMICKEIQYEYISNGHLLSKTTEWPTLAKEVTTTYLNHNSTSGVAQRVEVSSQGLPTIYTDYYYDPMFRYVQWKNSSGLNTHATYDEMSGNILKEINLVGDSTVYTYTEFHQPKTIKDYLGNVETISYHWDLLLAPGTEWTAVSNSWYHIEREKSGLADISEYFDILGRNRKILTEGFSGQDLVTITSYHPFGGVRSTTSPFEPTMQSTAVLTKYTYDPDINRILTTSVSNSGTTIATSYDYANNPGSNTIAKHQKVTVTSPYGETWTKTDMTGQVVESHDEGGTLSFDYDSRGNTLQVSSGSVIHSEMTYDAYGRQETLHLPNGGGLMNYEYNAYGQLASQGVGSNLQTKVYDNKGRIETETTSLGTNNYSYYSTGNGIGQLQADGSRYLTYDAHGRVEYIGSGGGSYHQELEYDGLGRLSKKTYHLENNHVFDINYIFNNKGYLDKIVYDDGTNTLDLRDAYQANNYGTLNSFKLGNGLTSTIDYDAFNMPETYYTPGVQDLTLDWDIPTGNLNSRLNTNAGSGGLTENFLYDNLQRLESSQIGIGPVLAADINAAGNYLAKHDAGTEYEGTQKATGVKNNYFEIPLDIQNVSYNGINEPDQITEGNWEVTFNYALNKSRTYSHAINTVTPSESETRQHIPALGVETVSKNGKLYQMTYVRLTDNTMALILKEDQECPCPEPPGGGEPGEGGEEPGGGGTAGTWISECDIYFVYTDHLGSWLHVTDAMGNILPDAEQDFDAWGRRRDPQTWDYSTATPPAQPWITRGYTGHEHFDQVGIVHMNGRLYDPLIGRMFSPDNYVQSPFNTQSYDRYAYAFNNPVKYTDPSGEVIATGIIIASVAFAGLTAGATAYENGKAAGLSGSQLTQYTVAAGLIGAAGAGAGFAVGAAFAPFLADKAFLATAAVTGLSSGAVAFAGGTANAAITNNYLGTNINIWQAGLIAGATTGAITGLSSGLIAGYNAHMDGRSFWTGNEKPIVYYSPITDNIGKTNGECALRCFEEFSESYGMDQYDYKYWYGENGNKLGVHPSKVESTVENGGVFQSDRIEGDVNSITKAMSDDKRVMVGFDTDAGAHAVMVRKVKVYPNGNYRIWYSETSPIRHAPYSTNDMTVLNRSAYWTFYR